MGEKPDRHVNADFVQRDGGASLALAAQEASRKGPPPVHLWNPPYCGEIDMEIQRDGSWYHEGSPIGRHAMVRLFASILRLEEGRYFLVTPVEKVGIRVEDVPFIAVDAEIDGSGPGQQITFHTNVGDSVTAGAEHPLRIETDPQSGEPAPYVMVRRGLEARIDRKTFYRLIDAGSPHQLGSEVWFGIWAGGQFFPMNPARDLL